MLRAVGVNHTLSAGLVIGGKDMVAEGVGVRCRPPALARGALKVVRTQERITRMNILICTPGRILQHMDETVNFECNSLQILGRRCLGGGGVTLRWAMARWCCSARRGGPHPGPRLQGHPQRDHCQPAQRAPGAMLGGLLRGCRGSSIAVQTLLFSATQTKSVKKLARLSLRDPRTCPARARVSQPH